MTKSLCARKRPAVLTVAVGLLAGLIVTVVTPGVAAAAAGDISSVAGGGIGDGGPAATARVGNPLGINADAAGNVFFVDQETSTVRKVGTDGIISRVAGIGFPGFSGDGGPATQAQLNTPYDVAVAPDGTLFIADYGNGRIRKVTPSGTITTIAGTGTLSDSGDEGPATAAELTPIAVAVDAAGNVYFSDQFSYRVRRIDTGGTIHAFAGQHYTFDYPWDAGDGGPAVDAQIQGPFGLDVDAAGNVFVADSYNGRIRKVDTGGVIWTVAGVTDDFGFYGDGGPATEAGLSGPIDVDAHPSGRLFVTDQFNNRIRQIVPGSDGVVSGAADEIITTVAGNGDFSSSTGDGGPATEAGIPGPGAAAADAAGNLFISDNRGHAIRRVDAATQVISSFAGPGEGDGGAATNALLTRPYGIATSGGDLYVSEGEPQVASDETLGNRVRRIDATGTISTVAGNGRTGFAGDGGPASAALLSDPRGLTVDAARNLYIADCRNGRVRHVTPGGAIATVAGGGSPADGVGDGAVATASALSCPSGVEVDTVGAGAGAVYIADADSHRVRRVAPGADGIVNGGPDETITTVAGTGTAGFGGDGGAATAAQVRFPSEALDGVENEPGPDVTVDGAGNVYIADEGNHRVRRVGAGADGVVDGSPDESITTVAGNGAVGVGVDGAAATSQPLNGPEGVAIDGAGRLVIAETKFGRVRRVDAAGIVTTIAGTGFPGFSGDGGPATAAQLSYPTQVDYDAAGNLFITDRGNALVRKVEAGTPPPPPPAPKKKDCGAVLTKSTTLKADIGPCPGDGIVVGADNITIDLAGHRILGTGTNQDAAGIRLRDRTGVTIRGGATKGPRPGRSSLGTVTGFAGGVAIIGGSRNTVSGLNVEGNVGGGQLGDGIAIFFSPHNRILNNVVVDNGIYDGIGVLGIGSDHNLISGNRVEATTTDGARGQGIGLGIVLNPFLDLSYPRQVTHTGNQVVGNTVQGNAAAGISTLGNTHGVVARNTTVDNGFGTVFPPGNGIGIQSLLQTPPETDMLVESNQSHGNARSGVEVVSRRNTIRGNNAAGNRLEPGFFPAADLRDADPACADNLWDANIWGSGGFSPACTTAGGHEQVGPVAVASAPTQALPPPDRTRKHPPKPR